MNLISFSFKARKLTNPIMFSIFISGFREWEYMRERVRICFATWKTEENELVVWFVFLQLWNWGCTLLVLDLIQLEPTKSFSGWMFFNSWLGLWLIFLQDVGFLGLSLEKKKRFLCCWNKATFLFIHVYIAEIHRQYILTPLDLRKFVCLILSSTTNSEFLKYSRAFDN